MEQARKTYIEYLAYQRQRHIVVTHKRNLVLDRIKKKLIKRTGIKQITILTAEEATELKLTNGVYDGC